MSEQFRVVLTFNHSPKPITTATAAFEKALALKYFKEIAASGCYKPDSGRRVRVMSVAECVKAGIR